MKKIIILQHSGGRLADQLWRFASIYAYCLEKGFACNNYSFSDYGYYFTAPVGNVFINLLFFKLLFFVQQLLAKFSQRNIQRKVYSFYVKYRLKKINKYVISSQTNKDKFYLLPPSDVSSDQLVSLENSQQDCIYFMGNSFYNPVGLKKYHSQIREFMKPRAKYINKAKYKIDNLRRKYDYIVGVHVRHGDFKDWYGGKYYYSFIEVRKILDSFLESQQKQGKNSNMFFFYICSDEQLDNSFTGLNYQSGCGQLLDDLCSLSSTDIIIGSNSGFGAWAAYFANIPFVVFKNDIEWKKDILVPTDIPQYIFAPKEEDINN